MIRMAQAGMVRSRYCFPEKHLTQAVRILYHESMTEIHEHLRARAAAARKVVTVERAHADCVPASGCLLERSDECPYTDTPASHCRSNSTETVEVPVELLIRLREAEALPSGELDEIDAAIDELVALIPEPTYEPDIWLVQEYAHAQGCSNATARDELINLHRSGLTVSRNP